MGAVSNSQQVANADDESAQGMPVRSDSPGKLRSLPAMHLKPPVRGTLQSGNVAVSLPDVCEVRIVAIAQGERWSRDRRASVAPPSAEFRPRLWNAA
jgi:hypothetical protein